MNLIETLLPLILPLLGNYADGALPTAPKRLLYLNICALGEEGRAQLKKTPNTLDDAAFEVLFNEAKEEFDEAGLSDVPGKLEAFVAFA